MPFPFAAKRKNKYNAKKTVVDGITFDSGVEATRYLKLKHLVALGEIVNLELQPKYPVHINGVKVMGYKADFRYYDTKLCRTIVEDVKSEQTRKGEAYRLRKKLIEAIYQIQITEVL